MLSYVRSIVKFDWVIRDAYLKSLNAIVKYSEGKIGLSELYRLHSYIIRKLNEDFKHFIAVCEFTLILQKRKIQFHIVDPILSLNRDVDVIITKPKLILVEVKPGPPPWRGLNRRELEEYIERDLNCIYVWREDRRWLYTSLFNLEWHEEKVAPTQAYSLNELLDTLTPLQWR